MKIAILLFLTRDSQTFQKEATHDLKKSVYPIITKKILT